MGALARLVDRPVARWLAAGLVLAAVVGVAARGLRTRSAAPSPAGSAAAVAEPHAPPAAGAAMLGGVPTAETRVSYTVAPGDTLGGIAARFGMSVEALLEANGLSDPDALQAGQVLQLQMVPDHDGPAVRVVPDAELVLGPAYLDFDVRAFVAAQPGRLRDHAELVDGVSLGGAAIVERVAREFSVGPRVLLAFVEARSGWVTGAPADPAAADYPAGLVDPARAGLWLQLNWLADRLNGGYYDWKTRGNRIVTLRDGAILGGHPDLNAGSFAVQRALGFQSTEAELVARLAEVDAAYRRLFGDPWARAAAGPDPAAAPFPELGLPWAQGERWWMTGGPHGGWGNGSAWAALDFVPEGEERGCFVAPQWATAVADGVLIDGAVGEVWLDLDGDGRRETGPAVQYLHLAADERTPGGTRVRRGDRIGHPSCEGGFSNATHVHIARMYDGEWLAAAGAAPMVLAGWRAAGAAEVYDGGLHHTDGRVRTACECRLDGENDVAW